MDYERILKARINRKTRAKEPFLIFFESIDQCNVAAKAIIDDSISDELRFLIERSAIITTVTAIEVYFRDVLVWIFKYCSPVYFEPKLKAIHPEKYDIMDVINIYKYKIHPLELVPASMSFQNTEQIEKVFSKFLEKGFWSTVLEWQVRFDHTPENIVTWTPEDFQGLKDIFSLRHELVHDPSIHRFMSPKILLDIQRSAHMIWGSNFVLMKMMTDNKDPSMEVDMPGA